MIEAAIAVLLLLGFIVNRRAHPSKTHVICSGMDDTTNVQVTELGDLAIEKNGKLIEFGAGAEILVNPPTCNDYVGGTVATAGGGGAILIGTPTGR